MVRLAAVLLLSACAGNTRPSVIPKLSELPADPARRDHVLDSAAAEPTPEQHPKLKPKERKAETIAATAAALIGSVLSDHENVTLGVSTGIEQHHVDPVARRPASEDAAEEAHARRHAKDAGAQVDQSVDVPWVRLK